jgi:hypothetical protein
MLGILDRKIVSLDGKLIRPLYFHFKLIFYVKSIENTIARHHILSDQLYDGALLFCTSTLFR